MDLNGSSLPQSSFFLRLWLNHFLSLSLANFLFFSWLLFLSCLLEITRPFLSGSTPSMFWTHTHTRRVHPSDQPSDPTACTHRYIHKHTNTDGPADKLKQNSLKFRRKFSRGSMANLLSVRLHLTSVSSEGEGERETLPIVRFNFAKPMQTVDFSLSRPYLCQENVSNKGETTLQAGLVCLSYRRIQMELASGRSKILINHELNSVVIWNETWSNGRKFEDKSIDKNVSNSERIGCILAIAIAPLIAPMYESITFEQLISVQGLKVCQYHYMYKPVNSYISVELTIKLEKKITSALILSLYFLPLLVFSFSFFFFSFLCLHLVSIYISLSLFLLLSMFSYTMSLELATTTARLSLSLSISFPRTSSRCQMQIIEWIYIDRQEVDGIKRYNYLAHIKCLNLQRGEISDSTTKQIDWPYPIDWLYIYTYLAPSPLVPICRLTRLDSPRWLRISHKLNLNLDTRFLDHISLTVSLLWIFSIHSTIGLNGLRERVEVS